MTHDNISTLKEALGIILEYFKILVFHPMIDILKLSSNMLDCDESMDEKLQEIKTARENRIVFLKTWLKEILKLEKLHNQFLFSFEGETGDEFRVMTKEFERWLANNITDKIDNYERYDDIFKKFNDVPKEDRFSVASYYYSSEYVYALADFFSF